MKEIVALKNRIAERVTYGDLLIRDGRISGALPEEQFSCTFHGKDVKKSARYYKESDSSYCWVCKKKKDIYSYVQEKEQMGFWEAVRYLVRTYTIPIDDLPDAIREPRKTTDAEIKTKLDGKKIASEKLAKAIRMLRGLVDDIRYEKLVFAFMLLKYATSEDKKAEASEVLRKAVLKVVEDTKNGR